MQSLKEISYILLFLVSFLAYSCFAGTDESIFDDDIIDGEQTKPVFFDNSRQPVINQNEMDIIRIFGQPAGRYTYLKPFKKIINDDSFYVDRILEYTLCSPQLLPSIRQETFYMTVFLHQQRVVFVTLHQIFLLQNGQTVYGPFHTHPGTKGYRWINGRDDAERYWCQRSPQVRNRRIHGFDNLVSCSRF